MDTTDISFPICPLVVHAPIKKQIPFTTARTYTCLGMSYDGESYQLPREVHLMENVAYMAILREDQTADIVPAIIIDALARAHAEEDERKALEAAEDA